MNELMRENGVRTVTGYDGEGRQTGVSHQIGLSVLDGVGYGLDSMGRRTSITRPGGQNDNYVYDAAGQVTAGSYLATPSGNQSDGFVYDGMGNRTTSARNGVNVSYSANALEQYSAVGGAVPTYDAGGNTLSLPVPGSVTVEMTWDAENRMLSSTRNGAAVLPLASSLVNGARVVNRYDVLRRRVVKEVHAPNGSGGWTLQERRLFTYDGWNVIEERAFDAGGSLVAWQRLTWGRDASGRLQGAGGVGGLLLAEELPVSGVGSAVGHYPGCDGNGNVVLMTTGSGLVEGRWRYGAFGGTLGSVTASGGYAERQPWRFSGKYLDGDVETRGGVYYYGYRHYVPEVGRWASRDPIGERGGVNLYEMVGNRVVNVIDVLGLESINWKKEGSLYERSGDFDLDDRVNGLYNENAHNYPVAHDTAKMAARCNSEGRLTSANWTFKARGARSARFELDISVEEDEWLEGENSYVGYATASYQGSIMEVVNDWAETGSNLSGFGGLGWVGGVIGGVAGGLMGLNADSVDAKSHIKVRVKCVCEDKKWKPKVSIVEHDDTANGDNY